MAKTPSELGEFSVYWIVREMLHWQKQQLFGPKRGTVLLIRPLISLSICGPLEVRLVDG